MSWPPRWARSSGPPAGQQFMRCGPTTSTQLVGVHRGVAGQRRRKPRRPRSTSCATSRASSRRSSTPPPAAGSRPRSWPRRSWHHDQMLTEQVDAIGDKDYARAHELAYTTYQDMFGLAGQLAVAFGDTVAAQLPQGGAETGAGGTAGRVGGITGNAMRGAVAAAGGDRGRARGGVGGLVGVDTARRRGTPAVGCGTGGDTGRAQPADGGPARRCAGTGLGHGDGERCGAGRPGGARAVRPDRDGRGRRRLRRRGVAAAAGAERRGEPRAHRAAPRPQRPRRRHGPAGRRRPARGRAVRCPARPVRRAVAGGTADGCGARPGPAAVPTRTRRPAPGRAVHHRDGRGRAPCRRPRRPAGGSGRRPGRGLTGARGAAVLGRGHRRDRRRGGPGPLGGHRGVRRAGSAPCAPAIW